MKRSHSDDGGDERKKQKCSYEDCEDYVIDESEVEACFKELYEKFPEEEGQWDEITNSQEQACFNQINNSHNLSQNSYDDDAGAECCFSQEDVLMQEDPPFAQRSLSQLLADPIILEGLPLEPEDIDLARNLVNHVEQQGGNNDYVLDR